MAFMTFGWVESYTTDPSTTLYNFLPSFLASLRVFGVRIMVTKTLHFLAKVGSKLVFCWTYGKDSGTTARFEGPIYGHYFMWRREGFPVYCLRRYIYPCIHDTFHVSYVHGFGCLVSSWFVLLEFPWAICIVYRHQLGKKDKVFSIYDFYNISWQLLIRCVKNTVLRSVQS